MCKCLYLLEVHSRNVSFDEDDSDVNMMVSDGGEDNSDILTVVMSCMNPFVRMMQRGKLPSSAYAYVMVSIIDVKQSSYNFITVP